MRISGTKAAAFFLVFAVLSACSLGEKRVLNLKQYALEYPPPSFEGYAAIDRTVRVGFFSTSAGFDSPAMVYRSAPYGRDVYFYSRWRVNPSDMVRDILVRDMRRSGLFGAVFTDADYEGNDNLVLQGRVSEFLEVDEKEGSWASLVIDVTLLEQGQTEGAKTLLFQRQYRSGGHVEDRTAEGFANGMSAAMEGLSRRLIEDIYKAVKEDR
jgi:ABC-type uncharacterized transport system auxiliary subunit